LASYSPYLLLYGQEPILPSSLQEKLVPIVDLDDPNVWAQCLHDQAEFFKRAMPIAMENLSIAQYCHTLWYALFGVKLTGFNCGDSREEIISISSVRHQQPFDVKAGYTILRVKDVLPCGILLLKGKDG